jgi:hypothetical protein
LLQVAMAFRLTHNRIAIRKSQSGLVVGTKLGTFGSEADASRRNVLGRIPKTSVCGQAAGVENQHAESDTYGLGTRGVFGQAVKGSLGRARTDAKLTGDSLPGCAGHSEAGNLRGIHGNSRSAQFLPFSSRIPKPGSDTLNYKAAL